MVGKILYLRQNYHFGPLKIAMYLRRYHDVSISDSGVRRILKRVGVNQLPASQRHRRHDQRWKRYEKPLPGHQVQVDVKFIEPIEGVTDRRYYQYTAIDDCTRLPFPRRGDPDRQRLRASSRALTGICSIVGSATHTSSRPRHGSTGGERSHRTDAEEFYRRLKGVVIDDSELFSDRLRQWEDFYNFDRPHGSLEGQAPYERLRQKTTTRRNRPSSVAHLGLSRRSRRPAHASLDADDPLAGTVQRFVGSPRPPRAGGSRACHRGGRADHRAARDVA